MDGDQEVRLRRSPGEARRAVLPAVDGDARACRMAGADADQSAARPMVRPTAPQRAGMVMADRVQRRAEAWEADSHDGLEDRRDAWGMAVH